MTDVDEPPPPREIRRYQAAVSVGAMALGWANLEKAPSGAAVVVDHEVSPLGRLGQPWLVPATSTLALTNATLPYLVEVAVHGATEACRRDPALAPGLNTEGGQVVNAVVAGALGVPAGTPSHGIIA